MKEAEERRRLTGVMRKLEVLRDVSFKHKTRVYNIDTHNIARMSLVLCPGRHVWLLELSPRALYLLL